MNTTKNYLIGAFSRAKYAQNYFDSLKVLGDTVEPIIIQYLYHGEFEKIDKPENVLLIKYAKEYPGNTGKHKDFRELISPLLERDVWCIFTDMHDVVFQGPLPEFPDTEILIASEAVKFAEVDYWCEIFPDYVKEWEVLNVGCFAMKRDTLRDFWEYLYKNWMEFYQWYKTSYIPRIGNGDSFPFNIPYHKNVKIQMAVMFNGHYDTLCFNEFLRKHKTEEVPGLFACYAYQVEKGIASLHKDNQLYVGDKLATVAHYNGATKKHYKRKEEL